MSAIDVTNEQVQAELRRRGQDDNLYTDQASRVRDYLEACAAPNTVVSEDTVWQLRRFRYDNGYRLFPEPYDGENATEHEIRELLIFAAGMAGKDITLPRTVEAHRVIRLVPEDVGAALFERTEP